MHRSGASATDMPPVSVCNPVFWGEDSYRLVKGATGIVSSGKLRSVKLTQSRVTAWDAVGKTNPLGAILTRDGALGEWALDEFWETGRDEVARFLQERARLAPAASTDRALDFGCGVGRISRALSEHCGQVTGVDVAESMIARAREWNADRANCTFLVNSTPDLSQFPTGSFTLVYSRLVLQHIPPPHNRAYIAELLRVLAPGGAGMFQVPQPDGASRALVANAPITGHPLKRLIPRPIVILWRRLKYPVAVPASEPWRQIYGVSRDEVTSSIERAGGQLLEAVPDHAHGAGGSGFEYWFTKSLLPAGCDS
jgi:SAM-dependent methyltransferase